MKFENISNHKYTTIKNAPTIYIIQLLHLIKKLNTIFYKTNMYHNITHNTFRFSIRCHTRIC